MSTSTMGLIDTEALREFIREVVREEMPRREAAEIASDRFLTVKEAAHITSQPPGHDPQVAPAGHAAQLRPSPGAAGEVGRHTEL